MIKGVWDEYEKKVSQDSSQDDIKSSEQHTEYRGVLTKIHSDDYNAYHGICNVHDTYNVGKKMNKDTE